MTMSVVVFILSSIKLNDCCYVEFLLFKISIFNGRKGQEVNVRNMLPNFVAIGQVVVAIWRYFDFSKRRPTPFWIFNINKI